MPRNARAVHVDYRGEGEDVLDRLKLPGHYRFVSRNGKTAGVNFGCPCGCGRICGIYFRGFGMRAEWDITGEWPNATASPSIGVMNLEGGGFHWHGWLRNGVFEEC